MPEVAMIADLGVETIRRETPKVPLYESVLIVRQDVSNVQVESLADILTKGVEDAGGSVKRREYWGIRNLAYRIKKNRKGHYVLLNLDAPVDAVHEMERRMRLNEDIIRHMTLRVDEIEEGPSVVLQNKGRDEGRPRRGNRDFGAHGARDGHGGNKDIDKKGGAE